MTLKALLHCLFYMLVHMVHVHVCTTIVINRDAFSFTFAVELSTIFPDTLMLGMEIRVKVSDYVMDRVAALREKHPGQYQNIACLRTNAMKYLPNFFRKGQVIYLWH